MNFIDALNTGEWITRTEKNCFFYKKQNGKIIFSQEIGREFMEPLAIPHEEVIASDWVPVSFDTKQIRISNLLNRMKFNLESYFNTLKELNA